MITEYNDPRSHRLSILLLAAVTVLCLLPFIGKAFNIDEPLFIWVARNIQSHPLDCYGFGINWYGAESSASEIIKNPPLASYYIAAWAFVGGWSEVSLHLAFLLPALAAVIGTYFLARELSRLPLIATLFCLATPVFILSSATVMCDTMMVASYVWAVFFWVHGGKNHDYRELLCAAFLVAISCLTKYFGISLIPLLIVYTLSKQGRKRHLWLLLIPIVILCCYQVWTATLYGRGLLLDAASYANSKKAHGLQDILNLTTGLSFFGGCLISSFFFMPLLWRKRTVVAAISAVPLLTIGFCLIPIPGLSWGYFLQLSLYMVAGIHLLALALYFLWKTRDAESLLLFLWIMGTFVFASFVNWSVNGRSILPAVPAAGMLIVRVLDMRHAFVMDEIALLRTRAFAIPFACAWLISMTVTWSDYQLAGSARNAAQKITGAYPGKKLVFQGHWGFQYYMEQRGAEAFIMEKSYSRPLIMAVPENNTNYDTDILTRGSRIGELKLAPTPFVTTTNPYIRAGYYSSSLGELPFRFGSVPDELYTLFQFI
ncbi:MAG TPA: glycosyltransferase family 39 protein [Desulfuromonadaceae bacterium]